jgi:hypothetical protein
MGRSGALHDMPFPAPPAQNYGSIPWILGLAHGRRYLLEVEFDRKGEDAARIGILGARCGASHDQFRPYRPFRRRPPSDRSLPAFSRCCMPPRYWGAAQGIRNGLGAPGVDRFGLKGDFTRLDGCGTLRELGEFNNSALF